MTISIHRRHARRHLQPCCQRCASQRYLEVHHKDRDWANNDPSNLETLCKSCHAKEHERWRNIRRKAKIAQLTLWDKLFYA